MSRMETVMIALRRRPGRWLAPLALVVVVLAILLAIYGRGGKSATSDEEAMKPVLVDVVQAVVSSMDTTISAQGTLIAPQNKSARVSSPNTGRVIAVRVREGDRVTAGQILAIVDSRTQQAQAQSAESAVRVSEIQARQTALQAQAAAEDQANAAEIARLDLESARTELQKLRNGARPQEIAQAQHAVDQAQASYDRTTTELNRVQFLNDRGIAAKRELDDAKAANAVAKANLESAKEQADLVRAGARPEDIRAAELRVKSAEASLKRAQRSKLEVAAKEQEAKASLESIRQKHADLAAAQTAAGYAELRAPIGGTVIRCFLNAGDMADPSTTVVEIADSRDLNILADIPAEDGMKARVGMPVNVSATIAPSRIFSGRVISIGQVDPQSGLLSIRVNVANPDGTLRVGAFATADIVLHTNPHAIVVPKEAIIARDGKNVVFAVGSDDVAHERVVVLGVQQGNMVEIVQGVMPGDRVIRLGQYELTDGMKVKAASKDR